MNSNCNQSDPIFNNGKKRQDSSQEVRENSLSRRIFLNTIGMGAVALGLQQAGCSAQKQAGKNAVVLPKIEGFERAQESDEDHKGWQPVSDRKVRVGLVGYGLSRFSSAFGFQDHPNVEIVAVSDIIPERCAQLAKAARCSKTYPSLEELVKDDTIEAVYVATDAPSHARHAIEVLKHGKHVAVAVPAIFGSLEEADELYEMVKRSGKKYMMFETSYYREDNHAMRQIYNAGGFGKIVYSEGEYLHYGAKALPSYKGWRDGNPPMFYLTHATAYYTGITGGTFTEVISCIGERSSLPYLKDGNNRYKNSFGTQVAIFRTSDGGMSRMLYSKDTLGLGSEEGRIRGEKGSYNRQTKYEGYLKQLPDLKRPPLPPGLAPGSHGGSHGHLTEEFIRSILEDRQPLIHIAAALNLSVPGIVAHQACLKGSAMKIPQYKMW